MINRRYLFTALAALAILTLTSCLDVLQTVERESGSIETSVRMTFSKSLIEAGASMSGESADFSDLPDLAETGGLDTIDIPGVSLSSTPIDTETEFGVMFNMSGPAARIAQAAPIDRPFLPVFSQDAIEIFLPPSEDAEEIDEMTAAFFGSAKYRVMIALEGRTVRGVTVNDRQGRAAWVVAGDAVLVELPILDWLSTKTGLAVRIALE